MVSLPRTPSLAERRDEAIAVILHTAEWFAMAARAPAVSSAWATIASATVITSMTYNARIASMATKTVVVPAMPVSPVSAKIGISPRWSVRVSSIRIGVWVRRVVGIRIGIIGIRGSSSKRHSNASHSQLWKHRMPEGENRDKCPVKMGACPVTKQTSKINTGIMLF